MADFNDKERQKQLGTSILVTIALLLLLAVFGCFQIYTTLRIENIIGNSSDSEFTEAMFTHKVLTVFQAVGFFVAAFMLYFTNSRWSVFFVVALMTYVTLGTFINIFSILISFDFSNFSPIFLLDLALFAWVVGFLLFSPKVEEIYHTGSRKLLTRGLANSWRRLRGRPTLDEIEAASLNQKFN